MAQESNAGDQDRNTQDHNAQDFGVFVKDMGQSRSAARTTWDSDAENRAPKTCAKKSQILFGARSAFYKLGFEGASVDEIARSAGVSKATLYNHYQDKTAVFKAIIVEDCEEHARQIFELEDELASVDIATTLNRVGRRFIGLLLSPFAQNMYRIVTGEALRFPALADAFCKNGPTLIIHLLTEILEPAIKRGELIVHDAELAAEQFLQLCKTGPIHRSAFLNTQSVADVEIERAVNGAVYVFISAYGSDAEKQKALAGYGSVKP